MGNPAVDAMNNAHALVVGIAKYQFVKPLRKVQDAATIARVLVDTAHCGYPKEQVELLEDEKATQAAVRQGLANLAQRTNPESTVFIYFSGHGGRLEDGPLQGQYLLPVDAAYPPA